MASEHQADAPHQTPSTVPASSAGNPSVGSTGVGSSLANARAMFSWTLNTAVPLAQWVVTSSYQGISSACSYVAPLAKKAAGVAYSASMTGTASVAKMVSDYRSGGKPHEAVEKLALAREWVNTGNEFATAFKILEPLTSGAGVELEAPYLLKNLIYRFASSVPCKEAKKELIALQDQARKNSEAFLRVDLKCLERFNQRLIDLLDSRGDYQADLENVRVKLVEDIGRFPNESLILASVDVPDLPLDRPSSPCSYVRSMDLQPDSLDIACQKDLNLSAASMPEYAELSGLIFWLETFQGGLGLGQKCSVYLERTTVVPTPPAMPAVPPKDPDQPD